MKGIDPKNQIDVVRRFLHVLALLQNDDDQTEWNAGKLADFIDCDENHDEDKPLSDKNIRDYLKKKIEEELGISVASYKGGRRQSLEQDIEPEMLLDLMMVYSDFVVRDSARERAYGQLLEKHPRNCLWLMGRIYFASKQGKLISFDYTSHSSEKKHFTAEPWHLIFRNNNLYLVAKRTTDNKVCLFVLNRLENLFIDDKEFDVTGIIAPELLFQHSMSSFISDTIHEVQVRFRNHLEPVLRDILAGVEASFEHGNDWSSLRCHLNDPEALCKQLLLYGNDIEITGSPEVRKIMIDMLKKSLAVYS